MTYLLTFLDHFIAFRSATEEVIKTYIFGIIFCARHVYSYVTFWPCLAMYSHFWIISLHLHFLAYLNLLFAQLHIA